MNAPLLIVVSGRPGSGKTTLAHSLARAIRCPVLCRDEFKEGLLHTLREPATPTDHTQLNLQVYNAFFEAIELLLRSRITVVAEAAFQQKLWQPKLQRLQQIAQIRLIVCSIDPLVARTRVLERSLADPQRELYHPSGLLHPQAKDIELSLSVYEPPHLVAVPLLSVDTTDRYKPTLEQIKEWVGQQTAAT